MTKPIAVHLVVADPEAAAAWYRRVFDAEERHRISLPDGQILTVELAIAETTVALSGEYPEQGIVSPKTVDGSCCAFVVDTHDADTVWQRALDAGAEIFRPLADTFWGERFGQVVDPYGHRWGIAQHLRDVPPDEVARAAARIFGGTSEDTGGYDEPPTACAEPASCQFANDIPRPGSVTSSPHDPSSP